MKQKRTVYLQVIHKKNYKVEYFNEHKEDL